METTVKPLISLVVPAYNEAAVLEENLSIWANRFLSLFALRPGAVSPAGAAGPAFDVDRHGPSLRWPFPPAPPTRSMSMEINPEVIYKAMLMRARIEEVPVRRAQMTAGPRRRSSLKVLQHSLSVLVAGFVFRPFMFFVLPGAALLAFAAYVNLWALIHFFDAYAATGSSTWVLDRASVAVATAFARFPHTFVVGGLSLMLRIQLMGLGILAMQNKKNFEERFYLVNRVGSNWGPEERTGDAGGPT